MIIEKIKNKIGIIYLDKAEKLNALDKKMVKDIKNTMEKWENNDNIRAILFDSKVEKGFSAGGDLKEIYEDIIDKELYDKDRFFVEEFDLDKYVLNYKKPIISHWFGVTMGGGVGLTINSDFIITDQTVNWAMPETRLGFVPDVGVGKHISKLPQALGQYVGLIGARLFPDDLVKYNIAHILIDKNSYESLIEKLFEISEKYEAEKLLEEFKKEASKYAKELKETENYKNKEKIEKYFKKESIEEIIKELEENQDNDFAKKTLENIKKCSPFMLKVQFEKYFLGKEISQEETYNLDLKIINYAIKKAYIQEGIRIQIIDKEDKPNWPSKNLLDVDDSEVKELLIIE
ncbi:3-hydroxyisobutyryl-CoA hydrolase [Anaerococcus porci]|uniref:3-hydroxyisobutyryl-CoA hydrolase n=1 Tax=Anaerococcus porci TaxID=2652269 RepID=A0A6N7VWA1_9FIRM|nr:3-hydroxyisobutyryl-CoA hydrolase [Anaerococcus porci]MDY3005767.1 3-hydroxyisobutyryl-CoA hydrolase [Anaerococcus porci]MSS77969.1 enoyl-CoA hydratase/isomerase family protein [Anaerococcus porci]